MYSIDGLNNKEMKIVESAITMNDHNHVRNTEALNRFYNDLYDKVLKFKYNDAEVADMYSAVTDFVKRIVDTVARNDPRLKIDEVISVGSAREGTQICTPCEYDFLLILKELSNNELMVTNGCPDSLSYVHVRLSSTRLQRQFKDLTKDGLYLKSTQNYETYLPGLPIFAQDGLRQIVKKALQDAAIENKSFEISTGSGILKFKTTNIDAHGPAFIVHLSWQKHDGDIMDISVDLCPAIRAPKVRFCERLVTPESVTCPSYYEHAQRNGLVLLIPCRRSSSCFLGLCFKVAHTETEMQLMSSISEHHKKCYKILKYIINGRPCPSIAKKSVLAHLFYPFYNYPTPMHSYALKVLVWNHHFLSKCVEPNCLSSCLDKIFTDLKSILTFDTTGVSNEVLVQNMLPCPFNKHESVWSKPKRFEQRRQLEVIFDNKVVLRERFLDLMEALKEVSMMENYNFENIKIETLNTSRYDEKRGSILFTAAMVIVGAILL